MRILVCFIIFTCYAETNQAKTLQFKRLDDTSSVSIQYQLSLQQNERIDTFIIPNIPHTYWETDILVFRSNQTFIFEAGVVLHAKKNCFPKSNTSYGLFRLNNIDNVNIIGNNSKIELDINEYNDGEWRHAVFVEGAKNFLISGLTISGAAGDGICISWNSKRICSENITIRNNVFDGNARQGISILSVRNLVVEGCKFINTGQFNHNDLAKHGPWSGIDLEPDSVLQILVNVQIENCVFENNKGDGLLIAFAGGQNSIKVTNCVFKDNRSAVALIGPIRGYVGSFTISEIKISGKHQYGIYVRDWTFSKQKVNIKNVEVSGRVDYFVRLETTDKSSGNKVGNISVSGVSITGEYTKDLNQSVGTGKYLSTKVTGKFKKKNTSRWQNFVVRP